MGKALSTLMRPVTKFNIENRAHRVIGREKPVPAPLHKSSKKQLDVAQTMSPSFMETHYKKDSDLNDRLKNIFVQSRDIDNTTEIDPDPNRPLPSLTRSGKSFDYGFWEPIEAAEGRCTLRTALTFMADHLEDPVKHSVQEISAKYKLEQKDVEYILHYYRVFKIIKTEGDPMLAYMDPKLIETTKEKQ